MSVPWAEIAKGRGYISTGDMLRKMYPKFNLHQLATRYGCSVDAVRRQLEKEGIQIRGRGGSQVQPKLDQVTEAEYREKGARAIAQEHGVDITSVYKHFRKRGIDPTLVLKRRARIEEEEAETKLVVGELEETLKELLPSAEEEK